MAIFIDDLAARGLSARELESEGMLTARGREVEQAHLERIRDTLTVLPLQTGG